MSFEAYEVPIHLRLVDQFSGPAELFTNKLAESSKRADELQRKLEEISNSLKGVNIAGTIAGTALDDVTDKHTSRLLKLFEKGRETLDKLKDAYKIAGSVTGFGHAMAMTLKVPLDKAMSYEQQVITLNAFNFDKSHGKGTTSALERQAVDIAKNTAGTTDADALRMVTESEAIAGNTKKAMALAPMLAKMRFGIEAYAGAGKGDEAENKFIELVQKMKDQGMTAHFSAAKYRHLADLYVKDYIATNGNIDDDKFIELAKARTIKDKTIRSAMGVDAFAAEEAKSGAGMQVDLKAKVAQLEEQFGKAALPVIKNLLEKAIPLVKSLGDWMEKHPNALSIIAKAVVAISSILMIAGPLYMVGTVFNILRKALSPGLPGDVGKLAGTVDKLRGAVPGAAGAMSTLTTKLSGLGGGIVQMASKVMSNPYVMGLSYAGALGYGVGSLLNSGLNIALRTLTHGNVRSLGEGLFNLFHPGEASAAEHDKKLMEDFNRNHPSVRPHSVAKINQNGDVYLDGKKVGKVIAPHVSREQAKAAARPTGGTRGYDPSMSPVPTGAV